MKMKMKTAALFLAVNLVIGIMAATSFAADLKLGYVRIDYIFSKYEPYQNAEKQFETYYRKEMDSLQKKDADLRKKYEDAQKNSMLLTQETLKLKQEELMKEQEALQKQQSELFGEGGLLEKKKAELLQPVIDQVNKVLMQIGKAEGYDFIYDSNMLLYGNQAHDLSDKVIEELKKGTTAK